MTQQEIHEKGFDVFNGRKYSGQPVDPVDQYNKIKIGTKTLDDAVLDLDSIKHPRMYLHNKRLVLKAIAERDLPLIRKISNYFYDTNGIYSKVCDYFAFMYRYDWYIVPEIEDESVKEEKVLKEFDRLLHYLDGANIKKTCRDIALNVVKNGAYYAYVIDTDDGIVLQELPLKYCRSNYKIKNMPVVEFNMAFFDECFKDTQYRLKVLKLFPDDIQKGYALFKSGKLPADYYGQKCGGWYTLDPGCGIKFSLNGNDTPLFINSIPALIDLDSGEELGRQKQMQQLQRILIQQLPLDKNGDLIFDVDEARDIHTNAVQMMSHSVGTDVLTTFADVAVESLGDNSTTEADDTIETLQNIAYNSFGVSRNLFNTDSNLSLEKSIVDDEATAKGLLLLFQDFFDIIVKKKSNGGKKFTFRLYMLETTHYNYKDLAKMYKEQVQIGYSKMLPQIAMGHSQSSIIHTAFFENNILNLSEIMLPPLQSSVMSAENLQALKKGGQISSTSSSGNSDSSDNVGRPEKSDDEKSEKTIANLESM